MIEFDFHNKGNTNRIKGNLGDLVILRTLPKDLEKVRYKEDTRPYVLGTLHSVHLQRPSGPNDKVFISGARNLILVYPASAKYGNNRVENYLANVGYGITRLEEIKIGQGEVLNYIESREELRGHLKWINQLREPYQFPEIQRGKYSRIISS